MIHSCAFVCFSLVVMLFVVVYSVRWGWTLSIGAKVNPAYRRDAPVVVGSGMLGGGGARATRRKIGTGYSGVIGIDRAACDVTAICCV